MNPEQFQRAQAIGCLRWVVDADHLESRIKDLIVEERTSSSYKQEIRALLLERDDLRVTARAKVAKAGQRAADLRKQHTEIVRLQMVASERGLDPEIYFEQLQQLQKQIRFADQEQTTAQGVAERPHGFGQERKERSTRQRT